MEENRSTGRIEALLARLSPRERKLLVFWLVAMGFIGLFLLGNSAWSTLDELDTKLIENQEALDLIARRQSRYLEAKGGAGNSVEARLARNELRLTTHLDKEASRYNVKITNFKDGSSPVGAKKGAKAAAAGGITEEWVTVDLEPVEYDKVLRFLDALQSSPELIVIKRIEITRPKRGTNSDKVEAKLTVSTFKKKKES